MSFLQGFIVNDPKNAKVQMNYEKQVNLWIDRQMHYYTKRKV